MTVMQQALLMASAPETGLSLPYTLDFNQASKAAALSYYTSEGFTITPLVDGDPSIAGALVLTDNYDDFDFTTPISPVGGGVGTAYIRCTGFVAVYPYDFVVELPSGTQAKQVAFDWWANYAGDGTSVQLIVGLTDTSTETRTLSAGTVSNAPFVRQTAFPVTPPGTGVYISEIRIRINTPGNLVWAMDNLALSA